LADGKVVICDRYIDSTTAYQSGGRGFAPDLVQEVNKLSTQGLEPDMTFLIDIDSHTGLKRAGNDKFESAGLEFHQKVRAKYLEIAKKYPRIKVIDGQGTIEQVFAQIQRYFQ